MEYSVTCNCGHEVKGEERRKVEAEMWRHAIQDHAEMVKNMSAEQFTKIMREWDEKFASQEEEYLEE
ncbi:hypothetical protein HYV50_02155 [Candidatus Pacearchaeota archaeon]|nr:hypothetical protein [Candidatus Pacearchaeota archaeon]